MSNEPPIPPAIPLPTPSKSADLPKIARGNADEVRAMMTDMGYDPIKHMIDIAQGNTLKKDHPLIKTIVDYFDALIGTFNGGRKVKPDELVMMRDHLVAELKNSVINPNIQFEAAKHLASYSYAKPTDKVTVSNKSQHLHIGDSALENMSDEAKKRLKGVIDGV